MEVNQNSTPLVEGHEYQSIKKCPKCLSVFVTDHECESCGLQLTYNPLGEAFGDKSFYGLKDSYWDNRSKLVQLWPDFEMKKGTEASKYKREMIRRYDLLLNFLIEESEQDRSFYWVEFQDLCKELICYGIQVPYLASKLNDHSFHGYGPLIHDYLKKLEGMNTVESSAWDTLLNYRVLGVLRLQFILICSIVVAAVMTASLLVYQYFFLYY